MDPSENIGMNNLGGVREDEDEISKAMPEETSFFENPSRAFDEFDDYEEYNKDIPIKEVIEESPYDENFWANENWADNTDSAKRERWKKTIKIKITNELKKAFREGFKMEVIMKDGPASTKLIKESKITLNEKTKKGEPKKVNGLEYKGVKVVFRRGKEEKFTLSTNERFKNTVDEFVALMEKARLEHDKTANADIEDAAGGLPGTSRVNEIRTDVVNEIRDEITDNVNAVDTTIITDEELRDLGGIMETNKVEDLGALDITAKYWRDKSEAETDVRKKAAYKNISDIAELKADVIRLENNLKPTSKRALDQLKNNKWVKFEKFKKWAKENLLGLSAISITIAGIIVTIFSAARTVVKGGADALGKFGRAVANIAKKFGPIIGAIGSIVGSILSFMAGGLKWLAQNLWILVVALTYFIYNEYKTRSK